MWALFIILCYAAFGHTNWIRKCMCAFVHVCMCPCKECVYRPQHTDGRLIKQLIKARELGSEMRLLLFGKNCSTHHKKEGERRIGRVERRKKAGERVSEPSARNVSKSVLWRPPPPQPSLFSCALTLSVSMLVCVCVGGGQTLPWLCLCLTVIKNLRKLFKSKAVRAVQKFLKRSEKTHTGHELTRGQQIG